MTKVIHGTIHGRTIQLNDEVGLHEGQAVRVHLTTIPTVPIASNRLVQSAGILANEWTAEDDRILDDIYQDRKRDTRRELAE